MKKQCTLCNAAIGEEPVYCETCVANEEGKLREEIDNLKICANCKYHEFIDGYFWCLHEDFGVDYGDYYCKDWAIKR